MIKRHISIYRFEPRWSDRVAWYASAIAATALSWCIWWLSPVMHQDPFVIFVLAVVFVARPFLRDPSPASDRLNEPGARERRRLELIEERDRALAALKELEFDHRTGKVSDDDYRDLVGPLRRRAAEALKALDPKPQTEAEKIHARG